MLSRRGFCRGAAGILLAGVAGWRLEARTATPITVYKSRTCGCCAKWVEYLRANEFEPTVHDEEAMDALKDELGIPQAVRSCHTALVGKYFIEGHVPASDIRRLLAQRPNAAGLAVPGMPPGTPGMVEADAKAGGYDVVAFQSDGSTHVFARH
jgi:hypothetical protein